MMRAMNRWQSTIPWLVLLMAAASPTALAVDGVDVLRRHQPLIVSYYWPVVGKGSDPSSAGMATPNVFDVLAGQAHGSPEVRAQWAGQGKLILNRVHPFRSSASESDIYADFAANMSGAAGISVDEIVAHKLTPGQRDILVRVLQKLRRNFPGRLIVAWDASRWDEASASLLRAMRDHCDLVILEVYIPERESGGGLSAFARRRALVEKFAPGVRKKVLFGIGAYDKMRKEGSGGFSQHLVSQVTKIRSILDPSDLQGLAIYAPVYLRAGEQRELDQAIRRTFFAGGTTGPAR